MNLEQKIEHVLKRVKDGYFDQSMPPEETDIDMVLIDCLKEIKRLRGMVESDDYVLVPREPTEEMWSGFARQLGRYAQMNQRFSPLSLGNYIRRFVGFNKKPKFLDNEVKNWDSDSAFATADIPVFIYKSMIEAYKESKE